MNYPVLLAAVLTVGAWGTALGTASAGAVTYCSPGNTPAYCELVPTKLAATPVLLSGLSATLTNGLTNAPLPGQTLVFSTGSIVQCVVVTDATGSASCNNLVSLIDAILGLGYTVTYNGTTVYAPSTAVGPLIDLFGIVLNKRLPAHLTKHDRAVLHHELDRIGRARLRRDLIRLRAEHHIR